MLKKCQVPMATCQLQIYKTSSKLFLFAALVRIIYFDINISRIEQQSRNIPSLTTAWAALLESISTGKQRNTLFSYKTFLNFDQSVNRSINQSIEHFSERNKIMDRQIQYRLVHSSEQFVDFYSHLIPGSAFPLPAQSARHWSLERERKVWKSRTATWQIWKTELWG